VNGVGYTWDNNGNLLNDGLRSYTYDHANRLVQVASGTLTTQFAYDGYLPNHIKRANELLSIGNRVRIVADGQATDFVQRVEERSYFGLDTDLYIAGSSREVQMEVITRTYIWGFLVRRITDACAIDWRQPDDAEIKALLTAP
jgi:hypothetical protein